MAGTSEIRLNSSKYFIVIDPVLVEVSDRHWPILTVSEIIDSSGQYRLILASIDSLLTLFWPESSSIQALTGKIDKQPETAKTA